MPQSAKKTAVYWHKDATGRVLYVGATWNPVQRMAIHQSRSCWFTQVTTIEVKWFESREQAMGFERQEIFRLKPKHNREWQQSPRVKWMANEGHVYLQNWLFRPGASIQEFAVRTGFPTKEVSRLFSTVVHLRGPKKFSVAIATDGFVPTRAWSRSYGRVGVAPIIRFPSESEAAEELKRALDRARKLNKHLPPYAYRFAENPPQSQKEAS